MDDLEFRRTIYADPFSKEQKVKDAVAEDPSKQVFWDELKQMEADIQQAAKVDVPEGLADRLILRQSIESHQAQRKRVRWQLAMAASVAFVIGLSFSQFQNTHRIDLGENALAHIYHESAFDLDSAQTVSVSEVNAQLASIGASLSEDVGDILYSKLCYFDNVRSMHLVLQGENGQVTVFIVPNDKDHFPTKHFADDKFEGETMDYSDKANLIIVGDKGTTHDDVKNKLKQNLRFSI